MILLDDNELICHDIVEAYSLYMGLPSTWLISVPALPERERQRILAIAREVRRHVRKESGAYCSPVGLCGEASFALSMRLTRAGIEHEAWGGIWQGPVKWKEDLSTVGNRMRAESKRQHAWISFPQYDGEVLDVTADQFSKHPAIKPIWFPAKKEWYSKLSKFYAKEIFEEAEEMEAMGVEIEPRTRIPLRGPLYRHPIKIAKVSVRRHLKRPPRSCLCHRIKSVDRVRRKMIRRLR